MDSIDLLARHVATTNRFDRSAAVIRPLGHGERVRAGARGSGPRARCNSSRPNVCHRCSRGRCEKYVATGLRGLYQNAFFHRAIRAGAENGGGRKTTATMAQFRVNLIGQRRSIGQRTNQPANRTRCNGYRGLEIEWRDSQDNSIGIESFRASRDVAARCGAARRIGCPINRKE